MPYRHVYIHVPFCRRRCTYCDFAIAVRAQPPVETYVRSIAAELAIRTSDRASEAIDTLYFGGGTPSRLGSEGIARLVEVVTSRFPLASGAEVTVEANPDDLDGDTALRWVDSGVNRVSLGVQSFAPSALEWMHRTHTVADVDRAARKLEEAGISNWSLDLIYALPGEVARDWVRDVESAVALAPLHISAYGLTFEEHTPLDRQRRRGEVSESPDDVHEQEFLEAHARLSSAGYEHYEVSNYARPGRHSRHNSAYWEGVPYLGLGPSAHGFDGDTRRWNEREYAAWEARVARGEDPVAGSERLTPEQRELERVYVGLRTRRGVELGPLDAELVDRWIREGWGVVEGRRLVLTPQGWMRLDGLVAALTEHRSRY